MRAYTTNIKMSHTLGALIILSIGFIKDLGITSPTSNALLIFTKFRGSIKQP